MIFKDFILEVLHRQQSNWLFFLSLNNYDKMMWRCK